MYGGGNTFEGIKTEDVVQEDPQKLAEFEARIARGEMLRGLINDARRVRERAHAKSLPLSLPVLLSPQR